jgi:hypothetical protein
MSGYENLFCFSYTSGLGRIVKAERSTGQFAFQAFAPGLSSIIFKLRRFLYVLATQTQHRFCSRFMGRRTLDCSEEN